ncbi:MAG: EamA family transporter [Sedimentisphaeraceae bacterium JB056]
MWAILGLISAVFLGIYDLNKKMALKNNAVIPVLFFSTVSGFALMLPILFLSRFSPEMMQNAGLYVEPITLTQHLMLAAKSLIVASSWVFAYFAIKHLPISIVTPIRSMSPLWTLIAAAIIYNERPNLMQFIGIIVVIVSFYYFSIVGKLEGIKFHRDKWVFFVILATLIGTASGIYDKFLIAKAHFSPVTVQAWFSCYLVVILGLVTLFCWYPSRKKTTPFQWRISIIFIGVFLIIADFVYFKALGIEGALLMILSVLRRSSVIISFTAGALMFKEMNKRKKAVALAGVLAGVFLILFGSAD